MSMIKINDQPLCVKLNAKLVKNISFIFYNDLMIYVLFNSFLLMNKTDA